MKKNYLLLICLIMVQLGISQPYEYVQPINPKDTSLVSSPSRRVWNMNFVAEGIQVDGEKDAVWESIQKQKFDRFITGTTTVTNGVYGFTASPNFRMPNSDNDFNGYFSIAYDSNYIYTVYEVTDNEINDGVKNPGFHERLEFVEAPYSDSAQQLLKQIYGVTQYPPYTGLAPELNKKFAYWAYLGAFKINMFLVANGKCNISFDEKPEAMTKIDYAKRGGACQCAWKEKADGSGYILEAALSLKVTLADSAGVGFELPKKGEYKKIAFDMFIYDYDTLAGDNVSIKASWNAKDNIVWDAMLHTGVLNIFGWSVDLKETTQNEINFYPNPAQNQITFTRMVEFVEVISMNGTVVKTAKNTNLLNVEDLASGMYVVKIDGKAVGKMIK